MKFNVLVTTSRSFTIELDNNDIVETSKYNLYLNDELYIENGTKNVISFSRPNC